MARSSIVKNQGKASAYSSEQSILLAYNWPENQMNGCLGIAIQKKHSDGTILWLKGLLGFDNSSHRPGELITSNEAPFQKLFWSDYEVRSGQKYEYTIIPVFGKPTKLKLNNNLAFNITINTEANPEEEKHKVYFNRAVIQSQAYVRNFGHTEPLSDERICAWLGRGLDTGILDFINRAVHDESLYLDMATYHFSHPTILEAVSKIGKRARISLYWPDKEEEQGALAKRCGNFFFRIYRSSNGHRFKKFSF